MFGQTKNIQLRPIFYANDIEQFSKFGPSDYESQFVSRTLHQVESEIIAYESSGLESQNFESSLEPPSSDSSVISRFLFDFDNFSQFE